MCFFQAGQDPQRPSASTSSGPPSPINFSNFSAYVNLHRQLARSRSKLMVELTLLDAQEPEPNANLSSLLDGRTTPVAFPTSMLLRHELASPRTAREWLPRGAARKRGWDPPGRKSGERQDYARLLASQWQNANSVQNRELTMPSFQSSLTHHIFWWSASV